MSSTATAFASPMEEKPTPRPAFNADLELEPQPGPLPGLACPKRKADLVLGPPDAKGGRVVKLGNDGGYFQIGPEESFLLERLDGRSQPLAVRHEFEARFGNPLSESDLEGFFQLAEDQGFLELDEQEQDAASPPVPAVDPLLEQLVTWPLLESPVTDQAKPKSKPASTKKKEPFDPLNIKIHLYDPSKLFNALYPVLRFVWTRSFLLLLIFAAIGAGVVAWNSRSEITGQLPTDWGWRTILLGWLVLVFVTTCHEFAHGLTCKHFGGEVRDVGFLMILVLPSFYCNVSDAWLVPERWKRMAVTFAGSGCDLFFWTVGVFGWRLTVQNTLINQICWCLISICGVRLLLNINPLIKLDGYYLAVDLLGISNLRQRSLERFKEVVRWGLWGGTRPAATSNPQTLALFGLASWVFSVGFLAVVFSGFTWYVGHLWGLVPVLLCVGLALLAMRGLLEGFAAGEVTSMLKHRRGRVSVWLIVIGSTAATVLGIPIDDRAGGEFHIRPTSKMVLRAPVAGFLQEVSAGEGGKVKVGDVVARLDIPDLQSRLAQKRAEIAESKAKLKLLKAGPRPEEVAERRQAVVRGDEACRRAKHELERAVLALKEEIKSHDEQVSQATAERDRASDSLKRDQYLIRRNAIEIDTVRGTEKSLRVAESQLAGAVAKKRAREAEGTLKAEAELARRESELATIQGELRVLEAGNRPEEIDAEASRLSRLEEEKRHLERVADRLTIVSGLAGVITTPRFEERIGRHFQEGEVIAEIESVSPFEAELVLKEYDVVRVKKGMRVDLKVRALPFESFRTTVDRIGIASSTNPSQSASSGSADASATATAALAAAATTDKTCSFIVYCKLDRGRALDLKTGMTGYGRVLVGRRSIAKVLGFRAYRMIRNEFWW